MLVREVGKRVTQTPKFGLNRIQGFADLQNQTRINRILAGGAPVNVAGCVSIGSLHERRQLFDQRNCEIAGVTPAASQRIKVDPFGPALRCDRSRSRLWNGSGVSFRRGEGRLEV